MSIWYYCTDWAKIPYVRIFKINEVVNENYSKYEEENKADNKIDNIILK